MRNSATDNDRMIFEEALILRTLSKSRIFSDLTEDELRNITHPFEKIYFTDREFIFMENDISRWLYIVVHGSVKTIKHTQSGRDMILQIKSPGEMLGDSTILDNKPYAESAQAKGDVTLIRINRRSLLEILDDYPLLKISMANYLNDELTYAYDMLTSISTEIVEKRIIIVLLKHSRAAGIGNKGYGKIDFPLTRQEIAGMVGTTVETCIRIMSRFQKLGIVRTLKDSIYVKAEPLKSYLAMN